MGLRVTVLMIGNDCHGDRNTYGLGYSYLMFISNTSLAAPGALAHHLQLRTACNTSLPALSKMADVVWE